MPTLINDIIFNDFFVAPSADRRDVVAIRPEFTAPKLLLYLRNLLEDIFGGNALDQPDHLTAGVRWQKLGQKMQVVLIKTVVADFNGVAFFNPLQTFPNYLLHPVIQQRFSVLYRDLNVIVALGNIVIPMPNWLIDISHNVSIVPP